MSRIRLSPIHVPGSYFAGPRPADIETVRALVEDLGGNFDKFKAAHNSKLDAIEASLADQDEELRGLTVKIAAQRTHGVDPAPGIMSAAARDEITAFARGKIQAAMSTQSNPDGGYLVPAEVDQNIRSIATDLSAMRQVCAVVVAGERYSTLMDMQGETATWAGETTAPPETQGMKLAELGYPTGVLTAMPKVTNNLLDDSFVDIASVLSNGIARAFLAAEELAFTRGDGTNKPRGLLTYETVANETVTWGKIGFVKSGKSDGFVDASATVSPSDCVVSLFYSLKAEYRANASFMMTSDTARIVRLWKDIQGRPLWTDSIAEGQPPMLLGKPVIFNEQWDSVGAGTFPIAFGDFNRAYLIHDLPQGIRLLRDPYSFKPYTAFYTTKRVGGGILDSNAIKLLKIAS